MNKTNYNWKVYIVYVCIMIFVFISSITFGQVKVIQFNAEWNKSNEVEWIKNLSDCEKSFIDIGKDSDSQKKHNVVVVPTIIILNDGEEIKRFQADLSFKMMAREEDVQEVINEIIMSDF